MDSNGGKRCPWAALFALEGLFLADPPRLALEGLGPRGLGRRVSDSSDSSSVSVSTKAILVMGRPRMGSKRCPFFFSIASIFCVASGFARFGTSGIGFLTSSKEVFMGEPKWPESAGMVLERLGWPILVGVSKVA